MNLAKKIRDMAKYLNEDSIAKAVGMPLAIVQGVITGEIPDETLEEYDPAKPPEIRVVEQTKYHRSKTVGFVSSGGCGASTIMAALIISLKKHSILGIDLNEYAYLSNLLDKKGYGLTPTALGWARGSDIDFIITPHTNYDLIFGVSSIQEYLTSMPGKMASLIRNANKKYEYLLIDCPSIPSLWGEVFQELDLIIWVSRTDQASLHNLKHLEKVIKPFKEKTMIIFNMVHQKGRYRVIPQKMEIPTIIEVPYFFKDVLSNVTKSVDPLIELITGKKGAC